MWGRRRIRQLEVEVAEAWAGQHDLRRRLELFERIAAAAGAGLGEADWWADAVTDEPPPPALVAAAGASGPRPGAVCLDAAGCDMIAVADQPGNAFDWWAAICCTAAGGDAEDVTLIMHRGLPDGLMAVARRQGTDGAFAIVLSDALDPARQREAVRAVIRAVRSRHWTPALMPAPVAAMTASVSAARGAAGRLGHLLRTRAGVAAGATAAAVGLAAAAQLTLAGLHNPNPTASGTGSGATRPVPALSLPGSGSPRPAAGGSGSGRSRSGTSGGSQPGAHVVSVTNPRGGQSSAPAPSSSSPVTSTSTAPTQPTPTPTTPVSTPTPTPTPTPTSGSGSGGSGTCVIVLGLKVCV